ncbi:hypothetical protein IFM89_008626 [Coptis chinensis]|uniref:Receptor-like serine/threonine-protein kinase n=1 Tax=Coptis chinensis TaxID=261450 RepID=A0A835GVC3_9MAGN|nr:hypothetical protein IFM89_008626 [Coptis chinensis]
MDKKENLKALTFLCFLVLTRSSLAVNLTPTQDLRDGETIISPDGSFEMGFFSPGNSTKRYLGIWFAKITIQTVVWVANRETPLNDFSGIFKIGNDGNFVVSDSKENILWSSNSTLATTSPTGVLLDTGNLVLRGGDSGKLENVHWQSFDHPTDTFLAGMKFGMNFRTGENMFLTSWKNANDPAPGEFSLGFDPDKTVQIIIWNSSNMHWRSGQWNGQSLTGVPEMTSFQLYGLNIISDAEAGKLYCTYNNLNKSIISSFVLTSKGKLERSYWNNMASGWELYWAQPNNDCQLYGTCGPHGVCNNKGNPICSCLPGFTPLRQDEWRSGNWSSGCVRKNHLECKVRNDFSKDGFLKIKNKKLPDNSKSVLSVEAIKVCEERCTSNCSCVAYSYESGLGCLTWEENMVDIQTFENDGEDLYIRLNKLDLKGRMNRKLLWIFVIIGLALVAASLYAFLTLCKLWRVRRKRISWEKEQSEELRFSDLGTQKNSNRHYLDANELEKGVNKGKGSDLPIFALDMIRLATDDFSLANKLGEGGFGPVYKGKIASGQIIAVKRLSKGSGQGMLELENEVILIAKLQHRNLVRLLGCCIQEEEKILIYEYMPNKSLDAFLFGTPFSGQKFDETKRKELDWGTRFSIIEGIARGLLYLHRDSRLRIIHRDLKASNILLDEEMNPKISDFGMARIFGGNQNQENTMRVVGTYGYMAPEYAMEGLFSTKSDVFSFGVLLLELVSGKRNVGFVHPDQPLNLLGHAWELWSEEKMLELVDPSVEKSYKTTEVSRCIQVGLLCVQDNATDRPNMDAVVFMLGSETAVLPTPKKASFSTGRTPTETDAFECSNCSANVLTISMELGR